jgi:hypothetical protein
MPGLSDVPPLCHVAQCQASLQTLRWLERARPCPRWPRPALNPWGTSYDRPGWQRSGGNGGTRTWHDLPPCGTRASARSRTGFSPPASGASRARRDVGRARWGGMAGRALARAGGGAIRPSPLQPSAGSRARGSGDPGAPRGPAGPRHAGGHPSWSAAPAGGARSASRAGGMPPTPARR